MSQLPQGGSDTNGAAAAAAIATQLYSRLHQGREPPQSSLLSIAHELPIAIYATDADGFIVYHNPAAAALWGYDPAPGEVRWCGSHLLFGQDGAPLAHAASPMARAARSGAHAPPRLRAQRRDGGHYTFVPHSRPLTDDRGRVVGAIHLILDVRGRDGADEETQRLAAIVESSDDAIVSKQLDGTITSWNSAAERLFGWRAEEIVGQSVLALIPEDRHDEEALIIERLRRGERIEHFETVRRHKSGVLFDISLTISPIRRSDGMIVGASKIARDITQKKQAEELLQRQAHRLDILNRVARIISQDLDLDRIVQAVTDEATALSGAQFGAFFHNAGDGEGAGTYRLHSLSGAPRERFEKLGMPRGTELLAATFADKAIVRSADIREDPRYGRSGPQRGMPAGHLPVVSYLAVPVVSSSGKVIGGLLFGHGEPDRFGPETETLISAIAAQAAVAIDNARLHQAAQAEIAQRKAAEAAKELLLHEVKHRVKNTLATVQALVTQTLKGTPAEEKEAFIGRLHTLSGAHDLLTQSDWRDIGLAALARRSLAAFTDGASARVTWESPDVGLSANRAVLLTMVLHELGTNAVKYGALSVEQGRVSLAWRMIAAERPTLRLEWCESGGPPVTPPARRGFGSRMIAAALQGSDGRVEFDYRPDGLRVTADLVL
ncbi:MAG: PAS domain S-box protein [Novosphingobium sp.]